VRERLNAYNSADYEELLDHGVCMYDISIYPSAALVASYKSMKPVLYKSVIGCIFIIMAVTFYIFNRYIHRRNNKVVLAAAKSNAIVSTIFPSTVRYRLFQSDATNGFTKHAAASTGLKAFLKSGEQSRQDEEGVLTSKPIADLFPVVRISGPQFQIVVTCILPSL
jgi:hypothetical protein